MARNYHPRLSSVTWNPLNPYVLKNWKDFYPVDQSTPYSRYLDRVARAFERAAEAAYEQRGYTIAERKYGVTRKDYEQLEAIADRYRERAINAMID